MYGLSNGTWQIQRLVWSITNWGIAGAVMVGLPASFTTSEESRTQTFMWLGFVSFIVIRGFLVWCEYRDAKEGF
jgi:hypothetical protein